MSLPVPAVSINCFTSCSPGPLAVVKIKSNKFSARSRSNSLVHRAASIFSIATAIRLLARGLKRPMRTLTASKKETTSSSVAPKMHDSGACSKSSLRPSAPGQLASELRMCVTLGRSSGANDKLDEGAELCKGSVVKESQLGSTSLAGAASAEGLCATTAFESHSKIVRESCRTPSEVRLASSLRQNRSQKACAPSKGLASKTTLQEHTSSSSVSKGTLNGAPSSTSPTPNKRHLMLSEAKPPPSNRSVLAPDGSLGRSTRASPRTESARVVCASITRMVSSGTAPSAEVSAASCRTQATCQRGCCCRKHTGNFAYGAPATFIAQGVPCFPTATMQ
mmetsp:Transcript_107035/g.341539  ORF Transcript_107035/g.341539 Transcript_107035/m.341539 type:complete len:336 (+) Transcript_107035:2236-3243(+)